LWDEAIATDLSKQVTELEPTVYFFHGLYNYTVSYSLAKDYFEKINAPVKKFYTFEQSAHSLFFEEPEKMLKILQKAVLPDVKNLATIQ
jgi:pimeloyl-ACP methyl ester carboxylesterase